MIRAWTAVAILAALVLVLLGRVIPLPPLVTGEEGSRTTLVQAQSAAVDARYRFQQAQLDYQHYLATHDIPDVPNELRQKASELAAGGDRTTLLDAARTRAARMIELGQAMMPYAQAGDEFFTTLQAYDDDLMSWSRTLGPRSEQLRRATWPILEWLKKYPQPVGEDTEFVIVPATAGGPMARLVASLPPAGPGVPAPPPPVSTTLGLIEQLAPQLDAPTADSATIQRLALAGDGLWAAGKNLPSVDRYHDGYFSALRRYDAESLEVAATPDSAVPTTTQLVAWGGAGLVGVLLLGALLLVFAPPAFWRRLPPLSLRRGPVAPRAGDAS